METNREDAYKQTLGYCARFWSPDRMAGGLAERIKWHRLAGQVNAVS